MARSPENRKRSKMPQGEVVFSATPEAHQAYQRQVAASSQQYTPINPQKEAHVSSAHEHAQQQQAAVQSQRQVIRKKAGRSAQPAAPKKRPASTQKLGKPKQQSWRGKKSAVKSLSADFTVAQAAAVLLNMSRSQQVIPQQPQSRSQHASQCGFFSLLEVANAQNDSVWSDAMGFSGDGDDSPPSNGA
jgi:hypothetical protein